MYGLSFALFGKSIMNVSALYYAVNTFIYTIVFVSISFFIGLVIKSRNAQAAIVNVLALGLSFISGVFVPQFLLGESVLRIASFTPTYWFVRANQLISLSDINKNFDISFLYKELAMQVAFIFVFIILTIVIVRNKRTGES